MSEVHQGDTLTREEWAARLEPARRLARFKAQLARARKAVQTEPALTDAELTELAQVFLDARQVAS